MANVSYYGRFSLAERALVVGAVLSVALIGGIVFTAKRAVAIDATNTPIEQAVLHEVDSELGLVSPEDAIRVATSYIVGANSASNVSCELFCGSSAPRYAVTYPVRLSRAKAALPPRYLRNAPLGYYGTVMK